MALKIVIKKRYINNLTKTLDYLIKKWSKKVAEEFVEIVDNKIILLSLQSNIGSNTTIKNTKSVLVGKGFQNRIYYRVEKNKLIIIDLKDIRKNPKQNRYVQ